MSEVKTDTVEIARPEPVGWFSLRLLAVTGVKALVTSLIGTQTGRRELLAALDVGPDANEPIRIEPKPVGRDDVWVDYVADLGDGFDATHSVAWLVGRDYLFLGRPGEAVTQPVPEAANAEAGAAAVAGATHVLPRADLLIFGGDEVYPYATQTDYRQRTYDPYYAARPWGSPDPKADNDADSRPLFVIPGNHDWYDGLISFVRQFCQMEARRWIGALFAQQRRSYFSLRLPYGWWIWGVDVATEDDIDPPQLGYFQAQADAMAPGDKLILCTAKPAWVECGEEDNNAQPALPLPEAWEKLVKIAKKAEEKGEVKVFLSGDLHHYARHETADGRQFITCGGGGAFTLGTTVQPDRVRIKPWGHAERKSEFPSIADSKAMRIGALSIVWRHKLFCAVLALTMLALVWLLQTDSVLLAISPGAHLVDAVFLAAMRQPLSGLSQIPTILFSRPGTLVIFALVLCGFCAFASSGAPQNGSRWKSLLLGTLHFVIQLGMAISVAVFVDWLLGLATAGYVHQLLFPIVALFIGTITAGLLFGIYLYLSNCVLRWHEQEVYSSQAIQDWKCFLRMRITRERLTIYPIGLRQVESVWERALPLVSAPVGRLTEMVQKAVPVFFGNDTFEVPKGTTHLFRPGTGLAPELIEAPVVIYGAGQADGVPAASPASVRSPGRNRVRSAAAATSTHV
ncbi:MAG: metallophosphoesterase [Rhodospirillales bacterium]